MYIYIYIEREREREIDRQKGKHREKERDRGRRGAEGYLACSSGGGSVYGSVEGDVPARDPLRRDRGGVDLACSSGGGRAKRNPSAATPSGAFSLKRFWH